MKWKLLEKWWNTSFFVWLKYCELHNYGESNFKFSNFQLSITFELKARALDFGVKSKLLKSCFRSIHWIKYLLNNSVSVAIISKLLLFCIYLVQINTTFRKKEKIWKIVVILKLLPQRPNFWINIWFNELNWILFNLFLD
jgi:hypothetical protein